MMVAAMWAGIGQRRPVLHVVWPKVTFFHDACLKVGQYRPEQEATVVFRQYVLSFMLFR